MDKWNIAIRNAANIVSSFDFVDLIDVLIVAFLIYQFVRFLHETRAAQSIKGIVTVLIIYALVKEFNFITLSTIMDGVLEFGVMAVLIVFQPELRRGLEQVGRTRFSNLGFLREQSDNHDLRHKWIKAIASVCDSVERLSDSKTGALIVFQRLSILNEITKTGTVLNAQITPETLGTIFYVGTPLHDGAVVIKDAMIESAGCFLPLSDNFEISKEMGTRHRAALGMSENSDAIVVVVSEETGIVSLAKNGVLVRRIDRQSLHNMLTEDLVPPLPESKEKKSFWRRGKNEKK